MQPRSQYKPLGLVLLLYAARYMSNLQNGRRGTMRAHVYRPPCPLLRP